MYVVPKFRGPLVLVNQRMETVCSFGSAKQAVEYFIQWWGKHYLFYAYVSADDDSMYQIRNCFGDRIDARNMHREVKQRRHFEHGYTKGATVPGIGKWNAGHHCWRAVRRHGLYKATQDVDPDEPAFRGKMKNRIQRWDHPPCLARDNRNWKRYRDTQYR